MLRLVPICTKNTPDHNRYRMVRFFFRTWNLSCTTLVIIFTLLSPSKSIDSLQMEPKNWIRFTEFAFFDCYSWLVSSFQAYFFSSVFSSYENEIIFSRKMYILYVISPVNTKNSNNQIIRAKKRNQRIWCSRAVNWQCRAVRSTQNRTKIGINCSNDKTKKKWKKTKTDPKK